MRRLKTKARPRKIPNRFPPLSYLLSDLSTFRYDYNGKVGIDAIFIKQKKKSKKAKKAKAQKKAELWSTIKSSIILVYTL